MAHIQHIFTHPYRLPMRNPFATAHGALPARLGALIELQTSTGDTGYGDIAPLPEFDGGTLQDALHDLYHTGILDQLQDLELTSALAFVSTEATPMRACIRSGLELALLDALGRHTGQSVSTLLNGERSPHPRTRVAVNAVIGALTPEEAATQARTAVLAGFRCIKLKVGGTGQETIERVAAVRATIGPDIVLRLDANAGWSVEQAYTILQQCTKFAIQYVEQPVPADDLAGMQDLRRLLSIPLAADEAVTGLDSVQRILDARAADLLIIKPQLAGGLRVSRQIITLAQQHRIPCVITSAIESGIGVVGALHLVAASPEVTLACGLATLPLLADDLLTNPPVLSEGLLTIPKGPGSGVQLDRQALTTYRFTEF